MIIKKLNSIFHKHSRILLLGLAVLVIIPFVLGDIRGGGCDDPQSRTAGTVLGEKVTIGDLRQFAQSLMLISDQRMDDWEALFTNYCYLKYAERSGVVVTDDEIASQLRLIFQKDGKFSKELYDKFLADRKLQDADLLDAIRLNLTLVKLRDTVCRGVVVTDDEVRKFYELASPGFELNICNIPLNKFKIDDAKEADLKAFYETLQKNNPKISPYEEIKNTLAGEYKGFKQRENAHKVAEKELQALLKLPVAEKAAKFAALKFEHKKLTVPSAAAQLETINKDAVLAQVYQMFNLNLDSMLAMLPEMEKSPNNQFAAYIMQQLKFMLMGGLSPEMALQTGEFSRVLDLRDSVALIQVVKRTPADMKGFAKNQEALRKVIKGIKEDMAFQEFHNDLMRQSSFALDTQAN